MKALVLAGGVPQIALIEDLKKRGITTILCDYYENSVARSHADVFYQVSTLDIEGITNVAVKEKVDFLITVCTDQALLTVASVSKALNLPCYIDDKTALNVTNKSYMKEVFVRNDIPTARHVVRAELDCACPEEMNYPLIVKPVDCNSSKGVRRVENDAELQEAFDEAVRLSRTKTAVIEEYIEGTELSVDVFVEEGHAHVLCVSELEKIPENDKFVIFRTKCPAAVSDKGMERIGVVAQRIADAFALKNSPMLIQMINRGDEMYVLEFSARTGGGEKFRLIKDVTGFDVVSAVVDLTLGKTPHVKPFTCETYYVNEFIYCHPGVFDRLSGFEELKKEGVLKEYFQFKWRGAEFDSVSNSGDRVAGFTLCGNSIEEVMMKHRRAATELKVLDMAGNDMMRHDIMSELVYA